MPFRCRPCLDVRIRNEPKKGPWESAVTAVWGRVRTDGAARFETRGNGDLPVRRISESAALPCLFPRTLVGSFGLDGNTAPLGIRALKIHNGVKVDVEQCGRQPKRPRKARRYPRDTSAEATAHRFISLSQLPGLAMAGDVSPPPRQTNWRPSFLQDGTVANLQLEKMSCLGCLRQERRSPERPVHSLFRSKLALIHG